MADRGVADRTARVLAPRAGQPSVAAWRTAGVEVVHRYRDDVLLRGPAGAIAGVRDARSIDDADRVLVNGRSVEVPEGAATVGAGPRVIMRFAGPVTASWKRTLLAAGGEIAFLCPPYGACVTLKDRKKAPAAVARLDFVEGFVPYLESHCERPARPRAKGAPAEWLDVVCFDKADRARVAKQLRKLGAPILDEGSTKIRTLWSGDAAPVRDLVGVKLVERPSLPRLAAVGVATDIDVADAAGAWRNLGDGSGETIAVADTGIDTGVKSSIGADLAGRVHKVFSWPINPSWKPFLNNPGDDDGPADTGSGHGTYTTGVAAGDGAASGGVQRGVAPKASIVFQAIEQWVEVAPGHPEIGPSRYALAGQPTQLRDLFLQARRAGARIHSNAWGSPVNGAYDSDSYEADLFLVEHQDALVLFAAGNAGSDRDANRRIDPGSLNSPATAKNVLTIGATEGSATSGYPGTWRNLQAEGRVYANSADLNDPVAGQPDRMALLSSAGPTNDGRIKPDVCAPGTNIVGPRSSLATGQGWGLVNPVPHYMVDGGTSAAVAVAGGAAAVLRRAWRLKRHKAPHGPTLKALMILGTTPVRTRDGSANEARAIAGFGRIQLQQAFPKTPAGETTLVLADALSSNAVNTGTTRTFKVKLPQGGRLRCVLCWYDAPGEELVNDLDLTLLAKDAPPDTAPVWGNHADGQPASPGGPDRVNTVEVVDVNGLTKGTYVLSVTGANVPAGPQRFSLVARGKALATS